MRRLLGTIALAMLAACGRQAPEPATSAAPPKEPRPVSTARVERSGE